MRYAQLIEYCRRKAPMSILEVGTWNGERALQMLNVSPEGCKYYGFDLFEDATPETDYEEMNVKKHYYREVVEDRLTGFDVELYKGNTRETLKNFNEKVDFVWLDGGHSVETIQSDWENVKRCLAPGAWVFLDDYYTGPINTHRYGCNQLVATLKHEILPHRDHVAGGGWVQMVRVYPED